MSKDEFLNRLSFLLCDISFEEREEALSYYREYIEDAGLENEEAIVNELGSVEDLAREIKNGLSNKNDPDFDYRRTFAALEPKATYTGGTENNTYAHYSDVAVRREKNKSHLVIGIIAVVFLSPIILPIVGGLLSVVFGIVLTIFGIALGIGIAGIALAITSIILFVCGLVQLLSSPLIGIALIGVSLVLASIGTLILLLIIWVCGFVIPFCIRGVSNFIHHFRGRFRK